MKYLMNKISLSLTALLLLIFVSGYSQSTDSLDYQTIMELVINNNPAIRQSAEKLNSSVLKEHLAKTAYLPNVYSSASASKIYPVPAFDFSMPDPETGEMASRHFQMVPDISMDYGIRMNQLIYDFGKTSDNVSYQKTLSDISRSGMDQLKQRLTLAAAGYFFNLVYVQQAVHIVEDEMAALKKHLEVVEKKQNTGSATQFEILSTRVRISGAESKLTDLETSHDILLSHLNNLMGVCGKTFAVKDQISIESLDLPADSFYSFALAHRPEMLIARQSEEAAEWNYKIARSRNNPTLLFFGSTGFKNGYLSDINALKYNYTAGLSFNLPLFDSNRKNIGTRIAGSSLEDTRLETENLQNKINDEVTENYMALALAKKKTEQFTIQLELAQEAYNHALTNYNNGTITNLDLLDSSNALAESRLSLLRAVIDYKLYQIRFRSATGQNIY